MTQHTPNSLPLPPPAPSELEVSSHHYGNPPTPPGPNKLLFSRFNTSPSSPYQALPQPSPPTRHLSSSRSNSTIEEELDADGELSIDKMNRLFEKKRKRRESHNVVERRRRDNINARIDELSSLLPQPQQRQKLNRGVILLNSVNHIRQLHQQVSEQQHRILELEALLRANGIKESNNTYTSDTNPSQPPSSW
ncbi:uncharacterized protein BX664DRAFT_350535 [Halteromyces radiatus]|uniref:uncharacterized protein n=1 Tax=Halteromyces radiatus TaxID=101107 RepID=UPI00221EAF8B|nr:uncharacterized protein BX664DRAFT_350535 [Halteromyces radiatus]KAI8086114.1 hypothetical protein BX664DRAFT_350535 [Halteromyces radiatus]